MPSAAIRTFKGTPVIPDELVNKAYVDASGGGGAGLTFAKVVKAADETVNNSNTFQDDDVLKWAALANKVYMYYMILFMNSPATADLKYTFTIPTGAVGDTISGSWSPIGETIAQGITTSSVVSTDGINEVIVTSGRVITGGTAGDCQLQWAQQIAQALDTKILQGSSIITWES